MRSLYSELDGKIITDEDTTLKVLGNLELSREDSGTNTVGNLEFVPFGSSPSLSFSEMGLAIAEEAQLSGVHLNVSKGGELTLQNGGTFDGSNVNFNDSVFKPAVAFSLTNGGYFNLDDTSSIVLHGDTTLFQWEVEGSMGDINWPDLDLNGNSLTLGSEVNSMRIFSEAMSIANGESLISGSSGFNLNKGLSIDDGGELISGTGGMEIIGALTLNGELEVGGGILDLVQGGEVGATGRLDVSDSELKLGAALNITGTLAANSTSYWSGWNGTLDLSQGTLEAGGGSLSLSQFITGAGTTLKLSEETEITSTSDYSFGTLELGQNTLALGGSGGLTLPLSLIHI